MYIVVRIMLEENTPHMSFIIVIVAAVVIIQVRVFS